MSKIYPSDENRWRQQDPLKEIKSDDCDCCMLTVWKRSSMSFQGTDGFTVFDHHGSLVFRVDNYSRNHRSVTVLMDGHGNPLLSLKPPQILSMQYQWNAYRQEDGCSSRKKKKKNTSSSKVFSMRSSSVFLNGRNKDNAEVFMGSSSSSSGQTPDFRIEGSFRSRNCKIRDANGGVVVAKIARKRVMNSTVLLSDDVFSLIIQPGYSSEVIMAFVIMLDRIASSKPYTPVLCS